MEEWANGMQWDSDVVGLEVAVGCIVTCLNTVRLWNKESEHQIYIYIFIFNPTSHTYDSGHIKQK
jgi:hypothetical protein